MLCIGMVAGFGLFYYYYAVPSTNSLAAVLGSATWARAAGEN